MVQTIFLFIKNWPKLEFFQVSVMYTKIVEKFVYIKVTPVTVMYDISTNIFCIHNADLAPG